MSDQTLNLTPQQAGDIEAATQTIYAEAADRTLDTRTLGLDLVALTALLLIVIVAHLLNPLLIYETQFGSAWRNATLQPVLAGVLAICAGVLIYANWKTRNPLKTGAMIALGAYTLIGIAALWFGLHTIALIVGAESTLFFERLRPDTPTETFAAALPITTVFMGTALIATVILWQPWTRLSLYTRVIRKQSAALIVGALVLLLWEVLIDVFRIESFLLPKPSVIGGAFAEGYPRLVSAGWNTFQNAFWGFVVGCGAGILTGIASARFAGFSRALLPIAIAINAIPIIALAPIMNNWFGALNPASKIAIVAILVYFPTMISTVRGLNAVDALSLELMQTYAASQLQIFAKLRLPTALPYIFSALKVGTTLAMIGAIVSEYFGGSTAGLGFRIRDDAGLFKYPEAWSAIFISAIYGILFYLVVSVIERALLRWHVAFRDE